MERTETQKKKLVVWMATPAELELIDRLKEALRRHSTADLLRYLVNAEGEKIFAQNCAKQQ